MQPDWNLQVELIKQNQMASSARNTQINVKIHLLPEQKLSPKHIFSLI